jgi:integrase
MTKGQNSNHIKKGQTMFVEPIRKLEDIAAIKELLKDKPRDLLLFVLGINNGLRCGDLLRLKVKDIAHLKISEYTRLTEGKTSKQNYLMMNASSYRALHYFLARTNPSEDAYLFASKKGKSPITIQRVNALVKEWCRAIGLKGNFGAHTLRKTWGYHMRMTYGKGFELIAMRFKHSNPTTTMRYLGIEQEEVDQMLLNEV